TTQVFLIAKGFPGSSVGSGNCCAAIVAQPSAHIADPSNQGCRDCCSRACLTLSGPPVQAPAQVDQRRLAINDARHLAKAAFGVEASCPGLDRSNKISTTRHHLKLLVFPKANRSPSVPHAASRDVSAVR